MTKTACKTIRELLVDYADGNLQDTESTAVRDHFCDCGACRAELSLLQRSLEHAQAIWQASASAVPRRVTSRLPRAKHKSRMDVAVVAAASALAVITAGALLFWNARPSGSLDPTQSRVSHGEHRIPSIETTLEMSEIESLIAREAQSARLAASSEFLAAQPSLADYREYADNYLATAYQNSRAGKQAK